MVKKPRDVELTHFSDVFMDAHMASIERKKFDVYLVGTSRSKEVDLKKISDREMTQATASMKKEWGVYNEFSAVKAISQRELDELLKMAPAPQIVDTRWVVTRKDGGFKSRLVAIGCQEPKYAIRNDPPTGSHLMIMITLAFSAQPGWRLRALDARSAYLQNDNISRLLLLCMPHDHPPPGCLHSQIMVALGSIYGTRAAGRGFY